MLNVQVFSKSLKMTFKSEVKEAYKLYDDLFNENVPYFDASFNGENLYFAVIDGEKAVGLLCLSYYEKGWSGYPDCQWAMMNIGVDPSFRGLGIARALIEKMFSFCDKNNISGICQSSYSEDGIKYIEPIFSSESKKYSKVIFKDKKQVN